jgi:hypothetical protein
MKGGGVESSKPGKEATGAAVPTSGPGTAAAAALPQQPVLQGQIIVDSEIESGDFSDFLINLANIKTTKDVHEFYKQDNANKRKLTNKLIKGLLYKGSMFGRGEDTGPIMLADLITTSSKFNPKMYRKFYENLQIGITYSKLYNHMIPQIKTLLISFFKKLLSNRKEIDEIEKELVASATVKGKAGAGPAGKGKGKGKAPAGAGAALTQKAKGKKKIIEIETTMLDLLNKITQNTNPNDRDISYYLNMLTDNLPTEKFKKYYVKFIIPFIEKLHASKYEITNEEDKENIKDLYTNIRTKGIKAKKLDNIIREMLMKEQHISLAATSTSTSTSGAGAGASAATAQQTLEEQTFIKKLRTRYNQFILDSKKKSGQYLLKKINVPGDGNKPLQNYLNELINDNNQDPYFQFHIHIDIARVYIELNKIYDNPTISDPNMKIALQKLIDYTTQNWNRLTDRATKRLLKDAIEGPKLTKHTSLEQWAISPPHLLTSPIYENV